MQNSANKTRTQKTNTDPIKQKADAGEWNSYLFGNINCYN